MHKSPDVVNHLMARRRLAWVPPETMRQAILDYIPLAVQSIARGTWPPLNAQVLVDPDAGAFAMAAPCSRFHSRVNSFIINVAGVKKADTVWYQIVIGVAVCNFLWLNKTPRDAAGNKIAASDLKVLDVDALLTGWDKIRPASRWNWWNRSRKDLKCEDIAEALDKLVCSLRVVPLGDRSCLHKTKVSAWARLLTQQLRFHRCGESVPPLVLGPSFFSGRGTREAWALSV